MPVSRTVARAALLAASLGQPLAAGELRLLCAHYLPDPPPPSHSNQVEGDPKPPAYGAIFAPLKRLYAEHADFGGARIVVVNDSSAPRTVTEVRLNGRPVEAHYVDFLNGNWDDRGVVWYRVRPVTLSPGQAAEIFIRFRRRPEGDRAAVEVVFDGGRTLQAAFGYQAPGAQIDYVTTDATRRRLFIYVRRAAPDAGDLLSVGLDGRPLDGAVLRGTAFPGRVALAVADLSAPLKLGDYHVVQATTRAGGTVAAQFRVLPHFFMRWSFLYRPSSPEEVKELGMNFADWRQRLTEEEAERMGVYAAAGVSNVHARHIWRYLYDEPDAKDRHPDFGPEQIARFLKRETGFAGPAPDITGLRTNFPAYTGLPYAVGLGRLARENILSRNRVMEETESPLASYLITDGTTRPLNWFVYGQVTDIAGTDPYPVNYYGGDLPTVREQLLLMRQAAAPRPTYACLEAYTDTRWLDELPDALRRAPSAAEFHQMAIQAIGCGIKGYTSWFWGRASGMTGAGHLPHLRAAYIRLNRLAQHIEDELLLAVPADLATTDAGLVETGSFYFREEGPWRTSEPWMKERVWTSALICGPDAVLVAAAHHLPAARMTPRTIEPARDVTVTVRLPDYLRDVVCSEVDADGFKPHPCRIESGTAVIKLDTIESGRLFLLRRR